MRHFLLLPPPGGGARSGRSLWGDTGDGREERRELAREFAGKEGKTPHASREAAAVVPQPIGSCLRVAGHSWSERKEAGQFYLRATRQSLLREAVSSS